MSASGTHMFDRAAQLAGLSESVVAARDVFARLFQNGVKMPYG